MSRDITKDIYGDLNYAPITLFGNKLNVGIIGAGRGALIKTRNFYNKGSNIEVLALEFLDDFYELDTNRVKLIKGCYKTQFIKNKHIIIIAVSESELINKIKLDCENHHKIYINSAKFNEGMGVIPVSRESKYISAAINTKVGNPRGAVLVANLITAAGADRVLTMDLHAAQIQGYFDIPLDHLLGGSLLANYFNKKNIEDLVVVSPDLGSVTRSRKFANQLDGEVPLAIIDKRRPKANVCEVMNLIGDVNGKNVIMLDDMIDTAGTITNAANALKEFGAKDIYACCTHAVLSGPAIERIENSAISELIVLDTIRLPKEKEIDKIKVLTVAEMFGEAIKKIFSNESVSVLF